MPQPEVADVVATDEGRDVFGIRAWWARRRRLRLSRRYDSGYDYGAGRLLRGCSVEAVEDEIFCMSAFDDEQDVFDTGVAAAVRDWLKLHNR